jgi:hypothetical protein
VFRENHEGGISVTGNILKLTFSMAYPVWPESGAFLPIIQVEILDLPSKYKQFLPKCFKRREVIFSTSSHT